MANRMVTGLTAQVKRADSIPRAMPHAAIERKVKGTLVGAVFIVFGMGITATSLGLVYTGKAQLDKMVIALAGLGMIGAMFGAYSISGDVVRGFKDVFVGAVKDIRS